MSFEKEHRLAFIAPIIVKVDDNFSASHIYHVDMEIKNSSSIKWPKAFMLGKSK